ncbi:MAG: hypothetical protein U9R08_00625 [Nanoarchaeota archaeon]|nr:hypothetical protein [Nanoarchaeota archaeon]
MEKFDFEKRLEGSMPAELKCEYLKAIHTPENGDGQGGDLVIFTEMFGKLGDQYYVHIAYKGDQGVITRVRKYNSPLDVDGLSDIAINSCNGRKPVGLHKVYGTVTQNNIRKILSEVISRENNLKISEGFKFMEKYS